MGFRKALEAAKATILVSLLFNLVMTCLQTALNAPQSGIVPSSGPTPLEIASWILSLVVFLGNVLLIVYCGYRAAKKGNDLATCGLAGLVTYGVVYPVISALQVAVVLFEAGGVGPLMDSLASASASGVPPGMAGPLFIVGVIASMAILWAGGMVLNFFVALAGGAIGGARYAASSPRPGTPQSL